MVTQRCVPQRAKLFVITALLSLSSLPAFSQPVLGSAGATLVAESGPINGAIDSGETVTVSFCIQNTGTANTVNLAGTLQATGGVTSPSAPNPQTYGVVVAGGPPVCRNFTFTAASSSLTATIQFQDGATNLGTVSYVFGCAITCPANITVNNNPNQCGAVVTYPAPTPSNASCGTITASPASGSFFPVGTTTVTASSASGSTCTFTVTVNDAQPPTVTCPANITTAPTSPSGAIITYPAPTALDNCPGVTVNCAPASGSSFAPGTTTITCTATDGRLNTASCSFTATVGGVADVAITKIATSIIGGGATATGQYTLTVTNNGPSTATAVTVTDPLPAGQTATTFTTTQGSCSGTTTVTCNVGTLLSGASATITIAVNGTTAGPFTNTATVSAAEADFTSANNMGSVTGTVITNIPTLSAWVLLVLGATLGLIAVIRLRLS